MAVGTLGSGGSSGASNDQSVDAQRRFTLLQQEVPELDANTMWSLASTSVPDAELVSNASKAVGLGAMQLSVNNLKVKNQTEQAATWSAMSTGRQQLFLDNGYVPPESAHKEDPMWQAPFHAIGWAWDKSKIGPAVAGALGAVAEGAINVVDDVISRPYRAGEDIAGQNEDARVDLMLNDARQQMEQNGVQLTEQEWNYLKWKFEEDNSRTRNYHGAGPSDVGRSTFVHAMPVVSNLIGAPLDIIAQAGGADLPGVKSLAYQTRSANMYKDHGTQVADNVYAQFKDAVTIAKTKKENDLSIASSWNRVDNGQSYVQPVDLKNAQEKLGGKDSEGYDIASYMAQNHSIDEYLTKVEGLEPNTEAYGKRAQDISTNYLTNQIFKDTVADLTKSSSKISIGRDFAETLHLGEDSIGYNFVSGVTDAAHVILMDPFLIAGKFVKIARVIQYGIDVMDIPAISHAYAVYSAAKTGIATEAAAVVFGENNIKYMSSVHSALNDADNAWAKSIFEKHGIDTIEPIFDAAGKPTQFLIDNYTNFRSALRETSAIVSDTVGKGGIKFAEEAASFGEAAKQKWFVQKFNSLANDIEQMTWGVARANEYAGLREVGPVASFLRNRAMQSQFRFMDRVMETVAEVNGAISEEAAAAAWRKLGEDLPRGSAWLNTLVPLHESLMAKGLGGIQKASDIYAHLSGEGLLGLQSGKLSGLAVNGFGHGMTIPDTWRLFATDVADAPIFRNRAELIRLPTLDNGTNVLRKVGSAIGTTAERIADMGAQEASLFKKTMIAPVRVPTMFVKSLLTRVPRVPIMSLTGEDGLARFKELVDQGVFFGMPKSIRDEWFGKMIVNSPNYMGAPVRFTGVADEIPQALSTLRGESVGLAHIGKTTEQLAKSYTGAAESFYDTFGRPLTDLVDANGNATEFFTDKFADIHSWVDDVVEKSYVDGEVVAPHLTEQNPVFEVIKQFGQIPTSNSLVGQRIAIQRGFIKELFEYMGMYKTEAGQKAAKEMLQSIDNTYSVTAPLMQAGSEHLNVALYPMAQHSAQMMMPDFRNLVQLQKQIGMMRKISFSRVMGLYNNQLVDAFMTKYWRPTALLRGGFVPSVGGDEYLAFVSRRGMLAPASNLATAATRDSRGPLSGLVSATVRAPAKAWGQIYKRGMADEIWRISNSMGARNLSDYMENVATRYLSKEEMSYLQPAREVAHHALQIAEESHAEQQFLRSIGFDQPEAFKNTFESLTAARQAVKDLPVKQLYNAFDHMALAADFYTAKALRAIRRIEFSALPPDLQQAVLTMAPATKRTALVEAAGLTTKYDLARGVGAASQAMMRGEMYKRIIHEHLADVGKSNYIEENISGQVAAKEIAMKNSAYSGERFVLKVNDNGHWATFDTAEHLLDESAPQRAVKYHLLSNDPIARIAINEGLAGRITPTELDTVANAFHGLTGGFAQPVSASSTLEEKLAAFNGLRGRLGMTENNGYVDDLAHWLQQDRALRRVPATIYDDSATLTAEELNQLHPELRDALLAMPEDSQLEYLIKQVFNRSDMGNEGLVHGAEPMTYMEQRFNDLVILNRLSAQNKGMAHLAISKRIPLRIANYEEDVKAVADAAFRELQNPHYSGFVFANPRATYHNGVRVINPPTAGTRTLYAPMIDKNTADHINVILSADGGHDRLFNEIIGANATNEERSLLNQLLVQWHTQGTNSLIETKDTLSNGVMIPFSTSGFTNYDDAKMISELLDRWHVNPQMPDGSMSPLINNPKIVGPGYLEIPHTNQIKYIPFNDRQAIINLHPEDQLITLENPTLEKFMPFGNRTMRRYDDYGNIASDGAHVREGSLHTDALRDWADNIATDLMQMHQTPTGGYLHEIIEPMMRNRFDINSIRQVAFSRMPKQYIAPEMYAITPDNAWEKIVKHGWDKVINPMIFGAVRHPMFTLSFADGLQAAEAVAATLRNPVLEKSFAQLVPRIAGDMNEMQFKNYVQNIWHNIHPEVRNTINTAENFENELQILVRRDLMDKEEINSFVSKFSKDELQTIVNWTKHNANIEQLSIKTASDRAINDVIPFIHDHHIRSVFQEYARNIMPFQFAQEQFLRRWTNTMRYSPEGLRRMQLIEHGLSSTVFSHEDPETGESMIAIPGSAALQGLLTNNILVKSLYGKDGEGLAIPVSTPLSMSVKNVIPDLAHEFSHLPSLGPLAVVSANAVITHFPEMLGGPEAARKIYSPLHGDFPIDTQRNVIEQFVPPMYVKLASGIFGDFGRSVGDVNATAVAAIQQMEAEGIRIRAEIGTIEATPENEDKIKKLTQKANALSLPDNASALQRERYLDNAKMWARANLFTRGITGFLMPSSSIKADFKNEKLAPEFGALLQNMSFEEALGVFLSEHPDASPFTVFASSKSTKAPLAPTEEALKWMDNNGEILQSFKLAGPWLMPQSEGKSDYSAQAYADMVSAGLRSRDGLEEWYTNYKYSVGANVYFPLKQEFDARIARASDSAERKMLNQQWALESSKIKAQFPVFAEKLASSGNDISERTLSELELALANPEMPDPGHLTVVRELVKRYKDYSFNHKLLSTDNSKLGREKTAKAVHDFLEWGTSFISTNPELRSMWNSLILPATNLRTKDIVNRANGDY